MDRWTDWAGTTSRNEFFFNTLDNLKQITGHPPNIRIGANSEDHTNFRQDTEFAEAIFPPPTATVPYPEALNITVGDSYYATTRFLPQGTHVTWGVNLGQNNITAAVLQTASIIKGFSSHQIKDAGIVLDYLEIGNEPDLYKNNGLRAKTYNVSQWVDDWLLFAKDVAIAGHLSPTSHTKFLGASFAGSSHGPGFSPQDAFQEGLLTGPGELISIISQHRYSGSFCAGSGGLLSDLMTKSTIRGNLTVFVPDIEATFAQGRKYILGETNSYACHGAPGVSNTAGAALWTLDYALYATQLGISRVFFHVGIGFKYSLVSQSSPQFDHPLIRHQIQPITLTRSTLDGSPLPEPVPAHVQPPYYAAIIAGEALGKTGQAQVLEINIGHAQIAGYGFYENGVLERAVFINSKTYLPENTNRTSVHLDLEFTGGGHKSLRSMTVKRLNIGRATDVSGLTWGGQTYETQDGRVAGHLHLENRLVSDGLDIQETEVILVTFKQN
ncbi:hypothetical protein H0H87_011961 [Tephrocybe sp. NHM501043]|nr:hypothetical protein H0H87_011961 [Tephrocybe sp. NHM501043]